MAAATSWRCSPRGRWWSRAIREVKQANFEVSLSRPAPEAFSVSYTTVDGSALAGEDYTATSGTLSFVEGQTSASVTVPVLGDTVVEPSDLFSLAFTVPSTIVQASLGEATILDDDAGTPTVSVSGASTTEGTTSSDPFYLNFAVTLSAAATSEVTVQYRLLSGTAQEGDDAYFPSSAQRDLRRRRDLEDRQRAGQCRQRGGA